MNCQTCNTNIDYRFLTNCAHCETEQASLLTLQYPLLIESIETRLTWTKRLINLTYIFISSIAGLVSGAVVLYFGAAIPCIMFLPGSGNASIDCAREMGIAFLSIVTGAFLGTIGGSLFAIKKPLCKN